MVLVDPADASHVTVPGENYLPEWVLGVAIIVGVVAAAVAVCGLVSARQARITARILGEAPWRWAWAQTLTVGSGESAARKALLEAPEELLLIAGSGLPVGRFVVNAAGDGPWVLRPVGTQRCILATSGDPLATVRERDQRFTIAWEPKALLIQLVMGYDGDDAIFRVPIRHDTTRDRLAALVRSGRMDARYCPARFAVLGSAGVLVLAQHLTAKEVRRARKLFEAQRDTAATGTWERESLPPSSSSGSRANSASVTTK